MKDDAIKKIYDYFTHKGYDFSNKSLLDLFARDGSWQTSFLAKKVNTVEAWEIDKKFEKSLKSNLPPKSKIKICNSIDNIKIEKSKFDIIVFDNPMGCYGKNKEYSEHFDIIKSFSKVSNDTVMIIFNVKTVPFNYKDNIQWQKRRNKFYKVSCAKSLSLDFLKTFYDDLIKNLSFKIKDTKIEKRPQETGLYQFAYLLERI